MNESFQNFPESFQNFPEGSGKFDERKMNELISRTLQKHNVSENGSFIFRSSNFLEAFGNVLASFRKPSGSFLAASKPCALPLVPCTGVTAAASSRLKLRMRVVVRAILGALGSEFEDGGVLCSCYVPTFASN